MLYGQVDVVILQDSGPWGPILEEKLDFEPKAAFSAQKASIWKQKRLDFE